MKNPWLMSVKIIKILKKATCTKVLELTLIQRTKTTITTEIVTIDKLYPSLKTYTSALKINEIAIV